MSDPRLVGVWSLERFVLKLDGGASVEPLGRAPIGRLVYTAGGFMSAHIAPEGSPDAATLGYCGRWRVRGAQVFHEVEISSRGSMAVRTQVREMAFDGDRLVLTAERAREGPEPDARRGTGVLRWRRIEGGEAP
jgi:hypothetical protein